MSRHRAAQPTTKPRATPLWFVLLAIAFNIHPPALCTAELHPPSVTNHAVMPVEIPGIHNAFRVTDRIFSGSQPEGDAAFAALARLGIKTLVSVDGSRPDLQAARQHGLHYIHLPIGYDGVPTNRMHELVKAASAGTGPVFVHCHHGLHRGPTAVAIMCEATEGWTPNQAEAWMRAAGTAADYPGLYRSAREFKIPTAAEIAAIKQLPEVTRPSSLVESMVAIDGHIEWLKKSQKAGWRTPPGQADISPEHEAMMLLEQFKEMDRTADTSRRSEDYRAKLAEAGRAAEDLHSAIRKTAESAPLDAAFKRTTQSCAACHKSYRNPPAALQ